MRKYNAESPKQGSKRFNSIVKTINIADLGIIYLWEGRTCEELYVAVYYLLGLEGAVQCTMYISVLPTEVGPILTRINVLKNKVFVKILSSVHPKSII